MKTESYKRVTIYAPSNLYEELKKRATLNHRSISSEINYLVERMIPREQALCRHHKGTAKIHLV